MKKSKGQWEFLGWSFGQVLPKKEGARIAKEWWTMGDWEWDQALGLESLLMGSCKYGC